MNIWEHVSLFCWGAATPQTVGTTSTSAIALSADVSTKMLFQAQGTTGERIHLRFGASGVGAATTTDIYLAVGDIAKVEVVRGITHFRAKASATNLNLSRVALP